ncbi:YcaO-like family protein [Devosia sp.]|uniref:YcaO-like family protein n=1 Tax=Devosia sp. TaxID=1871048 RepID=UPI003A8E2E92
MSLARIDHDPAAVSTDRGAAGHAEQLLDELYKHLPALGITRLARQTHLDRIGIPCFAAIRPNSATIASHQGKGLTDTTARVSAIMEAAEYALAEAPTVPIHRMSGADLEAAGRDGLDVASLLPRNHVLDDAQPIRWLGGNDMVSGREMFVPFDAVALGPPPDDLPDIVQSTNGIAAGRTHDGALLHALCELIERDAVCLWGFKSDTQARATAISPAAFADPEIDELTARIAAAGFAIHLFDQTTDLGIPTVYAALFPDGGTQYHHDVTTGASSHPVATIAARRAIVEAAQTRVTNIAGARDDFEAVDYGRALTRSIAVLTEPLDPTRPVPHLLGPETCEADWLAATVGALKARKLDRIISVPLGGEALGIFVLKAFVPGLEDRLTNRHWRAGRRAASAMLGFL